MIITDWTLLKSWPVSHLAHIENVAIFLEKFDLPNKFVIRIIFYFRKLRYADRQMEFYATWPAEASLTSFWDKVNYLRFCYHCNHLLLPYLRFLPKQMAYLNSSSTAMKKHQSCKTELGLDNAKQKIWPHLVHFAKSSVCTLTLNLIPSLNSIHVRIHS